MIYFTKVQYEAGIWKVNVDATEEVPVKGLEDADYWRSWTVTPDGLYYVSFVPNPPYKIRFYDFATQQTRDAAETNLVPILVYSGFFVSPADKQILFAQLDQSRSNIMLVKGRGVR